MGMKNEGGYTLLEILAAITILGIILTVFFQLFVFSQKTTTDNREQLTALKIAEGVLERMVNDNEFAKSVISNGGVDEDEYDKYKVVVHVEEPNFKGKGVSYVSVKVYRKNADATGKPLSEVKGLVEP